MTPDSCGLPQVAVHAAFPKALERGELTMLYRPVVCAAGGGVVGAEAQVAWSSPELGTVPLEQFLPLTAEPETRARYLQWALQTVCAQWSAWSEAGLPEVRLTLQVSAHPIQTGELVAVVSQVLGDTATPAHALAIELTELDLQGDSDVLIAGLADLRGLGIEIVVSGLGAGPTILASLVRQPIDGIKIDAALTVDLATDAAAASVTLALIQIAHSLKLRTIADGVNNEAQLNLLLDQGCDLLQGSHLGDAVTGEVFATLHTNGDHLPDKFSPPCESRRSLLLVDDEAHILSSLKRLFRRDGYRVLTASSGLEALQVLADNPVDVILSDQRMPGMTGVEFLRKAKELYPDTVRMTLSGYTDLQSIIDAVNEGAVYKFLTKPWNDERLHEHVALAFQQHGLAEDNQRLNRDLVNANRRLERLISTEHTRRRAMQAAAGASKDMLDLMPMAVFGVGSEGILAYVNRCALTDWPAWGSALGDEPEPDLLHLLESLDERSESGTSEGASLELGGRQVTAWKRTLYAAKDILGSLLILQEQPPGSPQTKRLAP